MHIHGHPTSFNAVDLSSARAAERAVSAQRAADVRDRLLRGGPEVEDEMNPFESFMVSSEPEGSSRQQQSRNRQSSSRPAARFQPADNEQRDEPLSFWA